jgi:hypothetical protein
MATRSSHPPRVEHPQHLQRQRSSTLASCDSAPSPASSDSLQQQQPLPRARRRTLGQQDDDDLAAERRRSSLISRTEPTPVPAIPKHFLHTRNSSLPHHISNSPRSHAAPSTTTATATTTTPSTPSYNARNHAYNRDSRGAPASSPLAHDFDFSFTVDTPLRALSQAQATHQTPRGASYYNSSRRPAPRHAVVANFSTPRPTLLPAQTSSHTRAGSLPTTTLTGKRRPSKDEATLEALTAQDAGMDQTQPEANADLFLQLAEDANSSDSEPTLTQRAPSRATWNDKRQQSIPSSPRTSVENGRPRAAARPSSRFSTHIDTNRANTGYRTPGPTPTTSFTSPRYDQTTPGSAHLRRKTPFSNAPDCSPRSATQHYERTQSPEKSPELPTFGRRRPSFGYPASTSHTKRHSGISAKPQGSDGESPANSSETKQSAAESDSVDSQTAPSTVWDELDDLKSRIKKLELTGKIPSTSNAAVTGAGSSFDRPRTATTAPTTINSSPKQDRKQDQDASAGAQSSKPPTPTSLTLADIHPTLHIALAKAKALLSATLYRSLEATAMDALQLVAMTGSAGPQGTTFSAASIINGVTVSDRHIRRKADMMCRNLTDLCLALCEGKHEAPSIMSSPVAIDTPPKISGPKPKYSRASMAFGEDLNKAASRPLSRLEARRSSILGLQPMSSPQASGDDISASEHETTPSHSQRVPELHRQSRLGNRLSAPRFDRYEEPSGDEDIRPPSRAMTEFGNFRSPHQQQSPRDYNTTTAKLPHRSPSLRESLNARRANATSHVGNRELPRVASLTLEPSRRRFPRDSTPPVLEEVPGEQVDLAYQRRRLTSFGHYVSSRRAVDLSASRSTSLSHRHANVMVE